MGLRTYRLSCSSPVNWLTRCIQVAEGPGWREKAKLNYMQLRAPHFIFIFLFGLPFSSFSRSSCRASRWRTVCWRWYTNRRIGSGRALDARDIRPMAICRCSNGAGMTHKNIKPGNILLREQMMGSRSGFAILASHLTEKWRQGQADSSICCPRRRLNIPA